jgi:F-type H+-transporting ATPase subunit epsilon
MAFQCTVATPEGLSYDGTITGAIVPAHDGQVGILTDRAPILLKLGAGELRLHVSGGGADVVYFVAGGVAQMKDNVLTILSDEAKTKDQLDVEAAKKDLVDFANAPQGTASEQTLRDRKMRRARAVLQVAGAA